MKNFWTLFGYEMKKLCMQEGGQALNGQVMDDTFFQTMKERVPDIENYDERKQWFYYKDSTYCHVYSMADFNNGDPRDATAESFYAGRRALLEQRWENYGLSETEKNYWRAMDERVSKPFVYEYPWRGTEPNGLSSTLYTILRAGMDARCCIWPKFWPGLLVR